MPRSAQRQRNRWTRPAVAGLALFVLCSLPAQRTASTVPSAASLPALLEQGGRAFAGGDFAAAAAAFQQVERDFGREPDWQSGTLPRRLLPLRGYAEYRAGDAAAAAATFDAYLTRFPDDPESRPLVLYTSALALIRLAQPVAAYDRLERFEAENPETAQALLARLQRAELAFSAERAAEGWKLLDELSRNPLSPAVALQARLRALQRALEVGDLERGRSLLLDRPWPEATMPEIGVLALSALELGDRLLAAGRGPEAWGAYRLVPGRTRLLAEQRAATAALRDLLAARAGPAESRGQGAWVEFYAGRLTRMERLLASLEAAPDHGPALRVRQAQAALLSDRLHEAWLLAERATFDPATPEALRSEAQYRWILAAAALERWEDALAIARDFVERDPSGERAPEVFFLIGQAHLASRRLPQAEEVLGDILTRFPGHPLQDRTRFQRGWVRALQERYATAREDFALLTGADRPGTFAPEAALWHALTRFFERDYSGARRELADLASSLAPAHPLHAEIQYRRAAVEYADRQGEEALALLEPWLRAHPHHPRVAEALVLLGDVCMGLGRLDAARAAFAQIPAEAEPHASYGAFQIGKILRAEEKLEELVRHFEAYLATSGRGTAARPRLSEALYWIGWAHTQRGEADRAEPLFLRALADYADDPTAGEIPSILGALRDLRRRAAGPGQESVAARDFTRFLEEERGRALGDGRATAYARLTLFLAASAARQRQPDRAEALRLEVAQTAPLESLDPAALGEVGSALRRLGSPEADRYFDRLLAVAPQSPERAFAYLGLAESARERRDGPAARDWLRRLETELPGHALAVRGGLLLAEILAEGGDWTGAAARYEEILRQRTARGRPHAEALFGLARTWEAKGDTPQAIAAYQRVFTLHLAQADLSARAYAASARLFHQLGDVAAAHRTLVEMTSLEDLSTQPEWASAVAERDRLAAQIPAATPAPSELPATAAPRPSP